MGGRDAIDKVSSMILRMAIEHNLERRRFASYCFADNDFRIVVLKYPEEANQTRIIASLTCKTQSSRRQLNT
jgi:hypothetical protein